MKRTKAFMYLSMASAALTGSVITQTILTPTPLGVATSVCGVLVTVGLFVSYRNDKRRESVKSHLVSRATPDLIFNPNDSKPTKIRHQVSRPRQAADVDLDDSIVGLAEAAAIASALSEDHSPSRQSSYLPVFPPGLSPSFESSDSSDSGSDDCGSDD